MENEIYICKCNQQFSSENQIILHLNSCDKIYSELGIFIELSSYIDSITNIKDLKIVKLILSQSVNKLDKLLNSNIENKRKENPKIIDINYNKIIDINSFPEEEVFNF